MSYTQRCVCMIMCACTYDFKEYIAWHIEEIKIIYTFIFILNYEWVCVCVFETACGFVYMCLGVCKS